MFNAANAAGAPMTPTTHARASRYQNMKQYQKQQLFIYSPPKPFLVQIKSSTASNAKGNPKKTKNAKPTLVHQPNNVILSPPKPSLVDQRSPTSHKAESIANKEKYLNATLVHQSEKSPEKKTA
jgi:hypothetical protein